MISVRGVARAAVVALVLLTAGTVQAVVIDTVSVGNAGNAADTTGYGAVAYSYNIGKYEVTAGQYTEFLNAVAATDTYGLYTTRTTYNMWSSIYGCKIERTGSPGSYTYDVASDYANRPVNFVSFWDACRFANWLHNGQQGAGTTEYGAYTLTSDGITNNTITRNTGAQWAVTSEDEWYKAAYYKSGGLDAGYWDYPTSSDTAPGRDMADASGNNANIYDYGTPYPIDSDKYTTVAGEFQNSDSPYGTFDQGGNVWEFNELLYGPYRGLRGGSFTDGNAGYLYAGSRNIVNPTGGDDYFGNMGFRVSEVPEPATMGLLALGGLLALRRRR